MDAATPSTAFQPDLKMLPWSRRGSFLSLSRTTRLAPPLNLVPQTDLYLVSQCVALSVPMFALRPLPAGLGLNEPPGFHDSPSPTTIQATISSIQWSYESKIVCEARFQDLRSIRLRGNVPLAFDSDARSDPSVYMGMYVFERPPYDGLKAGVEVTYKTFPGYRFLPTKGNLTTVNGQTNAFRVNRRIQIQGTDDDPQWELIIHELDVRENLPQMTWKENSCKLALEEAKNTTFERMGEKMAKEFDDFVVAMCPWAEGKPTEAEVLASYVTWTSMVRAEHKFTKEAVLMSKLWMNKVWSWDHCFNALAIAALDQQLGLDQLTVVFDHQAPDGRLPDSVDWQNVEWGFTKPPIQGWALSRLLAQFPGMSDDKVQPLYDATARLTDFWMDTRRGDTSRLPFWAHGNDSGWDNSTAFDSTPMIVGPDLAAYLLLQASCLEQVVKRLRHENDSEKWANMRSFLVNALIEELWDGESFLLKNAITGETFKTTSLLQFMPLAAARHLPDEVVDKMVTSIVSKHLSEWGLATEELASPDYESDGYWRGPIWAPSTHLVETGLRDAGRIDLADEISTRFLRLCEKSGFAENFDAITGEGLRDLSYTWTSAVYLVMRREAIERGDAK
ncbi:glycogen debranching protein [Colletotrichum scovillei]|uniref:Mannosyl-oligosaccharide glucosidase n=1 Tax=Colletotrichum scovillei TaxID=1209932 RepID=A0A9P7R7P7_9PEZI|nr:glycogen debranching protein [Colletotrichum scovillei]KAG7069913.1 glycogen debranching protein [Colletotrichum scovillei]KAG7078162.1 glycogen debranching protein [Colletotrichum scovillei]